MSPLLGSAVDETVQDIEHVQSSGLKNFRKKPVVIQAEQFFLNRMPWPEGVTMSPAYDEPSRSGGIAFTRPARPIIITLENKDGFNISDGDWIITGVKGEKYACKPDIFEATYEPVA